MPLLTGPTCTGPGRPSAGHPSPGCFSYGCSSHGCSSAGRPSHGQKSGAGGRLDKSLEERTSRDTPPPPSVRPSARPHAAPPADPLRYALLHGLKLPPLPPSRCHLDARLPPIPPSRRQLDARHVYRPPSRPAPPASTLRYDRGSVGGTLPDLTRESCRTPAKLLLRCRNGRGFRQTRPWHIVLAWKLGIVPPPPFDACQPYTRGVEVSRFRGVEVSRCRPCCSYLELLRQQRRKPRKYCG